MTNLHYKVILNNNVEYVFDKFFEIENYKQWTKPFNPHSNYSGSFGLNNEVFFHDQNNDGMKVEITKYEVNKIVEFTYVSSIENGVETKFENSHKNFERYTFRNLQDELVMIDIALCIPEEYLEFFEKAWAQSIDIIHDLFDNEDD